jgi:hypothetical protein
MTRTGASSLTVSDGDAARRFSGPAHRIRTCPWCGDVEAALRHHYDGAIAEAVKIGVDEAELRMWFAEKLITPAATRGLVYQGVADTGGMSNDIIALLDSMHVVRPEIRGTDSWYELTHDRLVAPIRESNESWFANRHKARESANPTDRATIVLDIDSGSTLRHAAGAKAAGTALCMSGSGYRSMLFQAGVLWRLNELGWLARIDRFCGVSGGAIATATLAQLWSSLRFDSSGVASNFQKLVIAQLRQLASRTIERSSMLLSLVLRKNTLAEH